MNNRTPTACCVIVSINSTMGLIRAAIRTAREPSIWQGTKFISWTSQHSYHVQEADMAIPCVF